MKTTIHFPNKFLWLLILLVAGCIQTSSEPEIVATQMLASPVPLASRFDLADGADLYINNCAPCHGETGLGDGPVSQSIECQVPIFAARNDADTVDEWYEIVQNGNGGVANCPMPPWRNQMSVQQMQNVTMYSVSLRYDAATQARGAELWEDSRTGDSPAFVTQGDWQFENSDEDILALIANNNIPGHDFAADLPEDDQFALVAHVRSLVFDNANATLDLSNVASLPDLAAQAQPTDEPGPVATEEASDIQAPETPSEPYTITGTVVTGTEGASLPETVTVSLEILTLDAEGSLETVYEDETTTDAERNFRFEAIPVFETALGLLQIDYSGFEQEQLFAPEPDADIEFTLFETTEDDDALRLTSVQTTIDAVTSEGASLAFLTLDFENASDRIFVGEVVDDVRRTLRIPLPAEAFNPRIQVFSSVQRAFVAPPQGRYQFEEEESGIVIYDSVRVFPGAQERILVSYDMEYDGEITLTTAFDYPIDEFMVFVSDTRGLELTSPQLLPALMEEAENGIVYAGYAANDVPVEPNTAISYTVLDGPNVQSAPGSVTPEDDESSFLEDNTTLILGVGVLLIILGGMFFFYDLQKTRILAQNNPQPAPQSEEDLIAQIAELDDMYETGEIDEEMYQEQRAALKKALVQQMR